MSARFDLRPKYFKHAKTRSYKLGHVVEMPWEVCANMSIQTHTKCFCERSLSLEILLDLNKRLDPNHMNFYLLNKKLGGTEPKS